VGSRRLLIFIVAYNAGRTLEEVLDRIPESVWSHGTRVLIIDDASQDRTFEVGLEYERRHPGRDIEVLFNPVNQGYGGNQKLGYQYAIEHGFDAVALLHGDGQYAPEKLVELAQPVLDGAADAVMGTRMVSSRAALAGGMPLYKLAGNRILTWLQNRLLGTRMSEFHSGYRVYSVSALEQIPFELDTSDFHFDTEILIQFVRKGLRILEIPIPVYYGDEICHVNGMAYAWNVIRTTVASRVHDLGILYQRKYDLKDPSEIYGLKLGYPSSHSMAIERVPAGARVLDLGCGRGLLAAELAKKGCTVHGVDNLELAQAPGLTGFTRHDLDDGPPAVDLSDFDVVLLLDILEHLHSPEAFLAALRGLPGADQPQLLISVPNIAFLPLRLRLVAGGFEYGREGILDLTHRRLFTVRSLERLLEQCGFRLHDVWGVPAPFPKAIGDGRLARVLTALNRLAIRLSKGIFGYQLMVRATALPTVRVLLERTRAASSERRDDIAGGDTGGHLESAGAALAPPDVLRKPAG
jgi:glycosyltransferase involved in cell wall biosynthesis